MSVRATLLTVWFAMCTLSTATVDAANCALRNPDRQIYEMFPHAASYRSVVQKVDATVKPAIEERLGSRLAFVDLGKHTIYLVFREGVPLGFVHARSAVGKFGSVELVWAMDLDMMIKDFRVQRSREKHTNAIRSDNFRNLLIGRGVRQVCSLLSDSNKAIDTAALHLPADAGQIAHLAVICGAKTLIITDLAFRAATLRARLLGHIHQSFPKTSKVTQIKEPFNSKTIAIIERLTGFSPTLIDRGSFTALRSLDQSGATLGALAFSRALNPSTGPEYWWKVTAQGRILKVWTIGSVDDAVQGGLPDLKGKDLDGVAQLNETSSEPIGRHALEVLAAFAAAGIGK